MEMRFAGLLELGDECRVCGWEDEGAIRIGGVDVVDAVFEEKWGGPLRVTINGQLFAEGLSDSALGYGYSEYTPLESDQWHVGERNVLDELQKYEGQEVVLEVTDGRSGAGAAGS